MANLFLSKGIVATLWVAVADPSGVFDTSSVFNRQGSIVGGGVSRTMTEHR
jgi:hypothetical protein